MLTKSQQERAKAFNDFLNSLPQFSYAPQWFIKALSSIIPSYCIFKRTIFYKNKLVCYIPELCKLNPFFNLIIEYRLNTYK